MKKSTLIPILYNEIVKTYLDFLIYIFRLNMITFLKKKLYFHVYKCTCKILLLDLFIF